MTVEECGQLLGYLIAAYPNEAIERESVAVYARELALLQDFTCAREAAELLVRRSSRFPTIAEFREVYRARRDASAAARPMLEAAPGPRELPPEARALLQRLEESTLPPHNRDLVSADASTGECADCGQTGVRFRLGESERLLCRSCALARLRVAAKLQEQETRL